VPSQSATSRTARHAAARRQGLFRELSANRSLYLLTIPAIAFFVLFEYVPMAGIVIAFQDFSIIKGPFRSAFNNFKNFSVLFEAPAFQRVVFNTLFLNTLFLAFGMFFSILIAVLLNEVGSRSYKKVAQSVLILPHFLSWTIVAMFAVPMLSSEGLINVTLLRLGLRPVSFYRTPEVWPIVLVVMNVWKGAGFGSIIYLATIAGISGEVFEAALIDGANRWQRMVRITLPMLKSTAVLLLLLNVGTVFYGNFGLIYPMVGNNSFLFKTTDIIDTYVYRALVELGDLGMSAAVGLSQSAIGFALVLGTNALARKLTPESAIF
jgi:putative aldouronate transport system permease protein